MSLPPPPNLAVEVDKCLYLPRQLLVDGPTNRPTLKAISRPASARAAGKNAEMTKDYKMFIDPMEYL